MNWSIWKVARVLLVVTVLSGGMLSGASDVRAQEKGSTLAQQIQGSWILVSMYNEQDGKKIEPFGPNPRGTWIFTPDGRFLEILMRASLPKFAANNRVKGTAEENQAVVQGSFAAYGSYAVASEKEHTGESAHRGEHLPQLGWPRSEAGHDRQRRRDDGHQPHRGHWRNELQRLETGQVVAGESRGSRNLLYSSPSGH